MKRWTLFGILFLLGAIAGSYYAGSHSLAQLPASGAGVLAQEPPSFRDVVKKVLPAVVSLEAKSKPVKFSSKKRSVPDDPRMPEEFRKFFEEFGRVPEGGGEPRLGFGSGFLIDANGLVLTNYHVVEGAESVTVQMQDGRKFVAKDIHGDRHTDLAIVKLNVKGGRLPYLEMGDSDAMEIGDRVLAVGAPFGLSGSVTHGIVSAKGRNGLNMNMYEDFLQTDAAINPGNSGGPLINLEGKVVGINSAIKSRSGGFQGVGLAIASNLARKVVKDLSTEGVVRRGYLGIRIRDLEPEVGQRLNLPRDAGVVVGDVFENTPAGKAGIQPGDIISAIAGKRIKDGKTLQTVVADLPLNKSVPVDLVRDSKSMQVSVTIEEQPQMFGRDQAPAPRGINSDIDTVPLPKIGIEIAELTTEVAEDLGYRKGTSGVLIAKVRSGSLAAASGLRPGMVIAKVGNQRVATVEAAKQALESPNLDQGVVLQVQSPVGGTAFMILRSIAQGE